MKKVLVTGGAGYLGSVLANNLLAQGHSVTVLDDLRYRQNSLMGCAHQAQFDFVRGDARDHSLMSELVPAHDVIIPLAALVGATACDRDPDGAESINRDAVLLLLKLRSPDQPILYPCTNSGYGTRSGQVECDEDTPMEPISHYGRTKVEAENALLDAGNTISLRLATVFGPSPRMRFDLLVNDFVRRAVSDGVLVVYEKDFKRNYVHIQDVADCFCFALDHVDAMKGRPYNVGLNDANLSKAELVQEIQRQIPALQVHFDEVGSDPDRRNYIISNARINAAGFVAQVSLYEGIQQLIKTCRMIPAGDYSNA